MRRSNHDMQPGSQFQVLGKQLHFSHITIQLSRRWSSLKGAAAKKDPERSSLKFEAQNRVHGSADNTSVIATQIFVDCLNEELFLSEL